MAEKKLQETAEKAEGQWPVVVAVHHRHGRLEIGELAVVIAVLEKHGGLRLAERDVFAASSHTRAPVVLPSLLPSVAVSNGHENACT